MENLERTPEENQFGFPTGKRELILAGLLLICGWVLCNSVFYGGFYLGAAVFSAVLVRCWR